MEPYLRYVNQKKQERVQEKRKEMKLLRADSFGSRDFLLPDASTYGAIGARKAAAKLQTKRSRSILNRLPTNDVEKSLVDESRLYEEAKSLFDIFDTDGDGWIDVNAFGSLIEETMHITEMDQHHNPREVRDIICHELFYKHPSYHHHRSESSPPTLSRQQTELKDALRGVDIASPTDDQMKVDMDTFFVHFKLIHRWTEWEADKHEPSFQMHERRYSAKQQDVFGQLHNIPGGGMLAEPEVRVALPTSPRIVLMNAVVDLVAIVEDSLAVALALTHGLVVVLAVVVLCLWEFIRAWLWVRTLTRTEPSERPRRSSRGKACPSALQQRVSGSDAACQQPHRHAQTEADAPSCDQAGRRESPRARHKRRLPATAGVVPWFRQRQPPTDQARWQTAAETRLQEIHPQECRQGAQTEVAVRAQEEAEAGIPQRYG